MDVSTATGPSSADRFRHEALLYAGEREFVAATSAFVHDALRAGELTLVVVNAAKIELLRASLGERADEVFFADMAEVGSNPARIIPAWRDFVVRHTAGNRRVRGIGEPVWPDRSPAELDECQRHESLLNLAFADTPPWWLLCPYDTSTLAPAVIDEAYRNHPYVRRGAQAWESGAYRDRGDAAAGFDRPLPHAPAHAAELVFHSGPLHHLRRFVARHAATAGLDHGRTADLALAATEAASNSIRHGGGGGTLRIWQQPDALVCEVRDRGRIGRPLAGREQPPTDDAGGRGLWVINQLCDLVQLRSSAAGTVTRLHMRR